MYNLFFLVFTSLVSATIDYTGYYPATSIPCLNSATIASKCDTTSVAVFNPCACTNGGGFVDLTAKCLGTSDPGNLGTVWGNLNQYCSDSSSPLNVPLEKFLATAAVGTTTAAASSVQTRTVAQLTTVSTGGVTTIRTESVTTVSQSALVSTVTIGSAPPGGSASVTIVTLAPSSYIALPTNTPAASTLTPNSKNLSKGAIIGIAVGVGLPITLALIAIIGLLFRRNRTKDDFLKTYHDPLAIVSQPRPVSSVTTFSQSALDTYPKPRMPVSPHQSMYGAPPPPGMVEVHGTPAVRAHELPGGFYQY